MSAARIATDQETTPDVLESGEEVSDEYEAPAVESLWNERWEIAPELLSWFEPHPAQSLDLLHLTGIDHHQPIIDVGAGASYFADYLLSRGFEDVTVLDISQRALHRLCQRLGECSTLITPIVGDVTRVSLPRKWDVWHDRAVFHFMVDHDQRETYLQQLRDHLTLGGYAIISTFADDGPEQCSGLPTARYSPGQLAETLGDSFEPIELRRHTHITPGNREQRFVYGLFTRR